MSSRNAITKGVAARAPGTSITRRRKPADAEGGAAKHDVAQPPAPAAPPPKMRGLQSRLDALHLRFRGSLRSAALERLREALATMGDQHARVMWRLPSESWHHCSTFPSPTCAPSSAKIFAS